MTSLDWAVAVTLGTIGALLAGIIVWLLWCLLLGRNV